MRILEINKLYHPVIGGIETVVKDIAEGLSGKNGITVDVLACQKKGPRREEIVNGIKVYRAASLGTALSLPLSLDFFRLFSKIKDEYDLVVAHFPFPLAAFLFAFKNQKKLIVFYHSDIVRQKFFRIFLRPFVAMSLKRAEVIFTSGQNIIESSSLLREVSKKCRPLPFGFNYQPLPSDDHLAEMIKEKYGQGEKLLLSVGRLVYYKGFITLVKAMKNMKAKLLIIGQGPEEKKIRQIIAKLNLADKVAIIPPQPRLAPYFLACDIFLFPSQERSEAFGLVQLEALAAGRPIINTRLKTAVEEVSPDQETGLTVETKNTAALTAAIKKLLDDDALRERLGKNARNRYQQNYTPEMFLARLSGAIAPFSGQSYDDRNSRIGN